ncbi:tryptophan synthase subunit alpha [Caulobacter hibisci]|uniref:Tryptophan synthase alpha chain n=1 Tax=Caulobacter hibisci TaxID=2035993 RepID=A0ABS0SYU6_9CAUL|nr:tryptophan synthase subunit alpha [Caulobacter hibisci]MBI1684798.1 tryptophan synthase subunit alpha [Caulobacter hibisci]
MSVTSYRDGTRLQRAFQRENDHRALFIAYIMAGDPDLETSFELLTGLAEHADVIELGMPFSDPMAEGPTIQLASQRSLAAGTKMRDVLGIVRRFRETNTVTPIVLMGYLNPVLSYGFEAFADDASNAGADGVIIVDCPPEEADALTDALNGAKMDLIRLATPTTDDKRLPAVVQRTSGFIYYVSVAGVTGVKEADADAVRSPVERLRAASGLPVAVGFGIKTPERAAQVARVADGVVVGSALVDEIAAAAALNENVTQKVLSKASELAKAVRSARLATV